MGVFGNIAPSCAIVLINILVVIRHSGCVRLLHSPWLLKYIAGVYLFSPVSPDESLPTSTALPSELLVAPPFTPRCGTGVVAPCVDAVSTYARQS
jgi:hypothetical protein